MGSFALKGYFFAGCSHESCDNCIVLGGVDNIVTEDRKLIVSKDKICCFVLAENRYNALIKWLDLKLRQVGKLELAFLHCAVSAFHSFSAKTQSVYKAHHFKVGKESLCFLGINLAQLIKLCSFLNRVFKTDERVEAYGTVDELAAFAALLGDNMRAEAALSPYVDDLNRILSRLMTVEALLACGKTGCGKVAPLAPEAVTWLEGRIDAMQDALKPIDKFTIPGGNAVVSMCHVCRTVCRRAERAALRADAAHEADRCALVYLNRLSDYFYLLGRALTLHFQVEETLWEP